MNEKRELALIWKNLQKDLGLRFIAYCLGTTTAEASDLLNNSEEPTSNQRMALNSILTRYVQVSETARLSETPIGFLFDEFVDFLPDHNMSFARAVRRMTRGNNELELENTEFRDLVMIARDIYPMLLISTPEEPPFGHASFGSLLHKHPLTSAAVDQASTLEPIRTWLADAPNVNSHFHDLQHHMFIEAVLLYAFDTAVLKVNDHPSEAQFCAEIPQALATAGRLVSGEPVRIPVLTALTNLRLPDTETIVTRYGVIGNVVDAHQRLAPPPVTKVSTNGYLFDPMGDLVLHSHIEMVLKTERNDDGYVTGWTLGPHKAFSREEQLMIVQLAATLAVESETPVAVQQTWTATFNPLSSARTLSWIAKRSDHVPRKVLTIEQARQWGQWTARIRKAGIDKLSVGARRLQTCIAEREDDTDRFVDSIVVWENIFGGAGESTLRITGSLSWLLAENAVERRALQREAADLYKLRSKVVHGSRALDNAEAHASAVRAREIAIDALRKIYTERTDLVHLDSVNRSTAMLLQL